jgi:hypothetical protein
MTFSIGRGQERILAWPGRARPTILLTDSIEPLRFVAHRRRPWDRLLARILSLTLDGMLAAGTRPEASRLLAVRADALLAPAARRRLGRNWQALPGRVDRPHSMHDPRMPVPRARIVEAAPEIHELVALLLAAAAGLGARYRARQRAADRRCRPGT